MTVRQKELRNGANTHHEYSNDFLDSDRIAPVTCYMLHVTFLIFWNFKNFEITDTLPNRTHPERVATQYIAIYCNIWRGYGGSFKAIVILWGKL